MTAASAAAHHSDRRLKVSLPECLRSAVSQGNVDAVEQLLDSGILLGPDKEGRTLLHIAAQNGHFLVVKALIVRSFDVNSRDKLGYTALHRASAQGHVDVVELLLKHDCVVDAQDECGNTALHAAAWNGCSQTVNLLICNEADITATNKTGCTALHLAAQKGHNQCARTLLYAGCSPDNKNSSGDTALHFAAKFGHAGIVKILISAKGKISIQNKAGETALHLAVVSQRQKIVKLLLDDGLNYKTKNKQGETALDIAKKQDEKEMVLLISSYKKQGGFFSLKKRKSVSGDFKSATRRHFDDVSDTRSSQSGGLACGGRFQYQACSPERVSSTTSGVAPSAQYSCDMAPLDLLGSRRNPDPGVQSNRYIGSTLQRNDGSGKDMLGTSAKFSCNMTPIELLTGFTQHRVKSKAGFDVAVVKKKDKPVRGLLSDYFAKPGEQYYKDLAGNLKKGPVGYTALSGDCAEASPADDMTYERLDASNHDLCVNTLDRRQQRRQVSLKLRQRSLGRLNGDKGEIGTTETRNPVQLEQESNGGQHRKNSVDLLRGADKGFALQYERNTTTGVVSRVKYVKEQNDTRQRNSVRAHNSHRIDRFDVDEGRLMQSAKRNSVDSRLARQSIDVVPSRGLQKNARGNSVAVIGEAGNRHATNTISHARSKLRATTSRQNILPAGGPVAGESSSSDVEYPMVPLRVVQRSGSRLEKFTDLAYRSSGQMGEQSLTNRRHPQDADGVYCQMDRHRNLLASVNSKSDLVAVNRSTECNIDTPMAGVPKIHRSRSDDTLSLHSRQQHKERCSKSSKWAPVGRDYSSTNKHQIHERNGDLYLIASPISPIDDEDYAESRIPRYESSNDLGHPDLLVAAKMRPFWDLKSPASASSQRRSPFPSPQDFSTPVMTRNSVTLNSSTFVDTLQSDDSPGSQLPAAPAASPVSGCVSTLSLPPPEMLAVTSPQGDQLPRAPSGQLHLTAECGSNPDSGYDGSKIYHSRPANNCARNAMTSEYVNVVDAVTANQGVVPLSVPDVVGWQSTDVDTSEEYCRSENSNTNFACYMQNATIDRMIFSPVRHNATKTVRSNVNNDERLNRLESVKLSERAAPIPSESTAVNTCDCSTVRLNDLSLVGASSNVDCTSPVKNRPSTSLYVDAGVQCSGPLDVEALATATCSGLNTSPGAEKTVLKCSSKEEDDLNYSNVTTNNNHFGFRKTVNRSEQQFIVNIGRSTTV